MTTELVNYSYYRSISPFTFDDACKMIKDKRTYSSFIDSKGRVNHYWCTNDGIPYYNHCYVLLSKQMAFFLDGLMK